MKTNDVQPLLGAEPPQRLVDLGQDRLARQPRAVRARPHPAVHLGGDDDVLAAREVAQRAPGELLARAAGVDIGGVERRDTRLERVADDRAGRLLVEDPRVPAQVGAPPLMQPRITRETSSPVLPSFA